MSKVPTLADIMEHFKNMPKEEYEKLYEKFMSVFIPAYQNVNKHICKTCSTTLTNEQFEYGKMCCDKPMFHDDHDE